MNITIVKKLPSAEQIIKSCPLSEKAYASIRNHKEEIKKIISGQDQRMLVIVGPCSAWPYAAVLDYANRLKKLNEKVQGRLKLILRVYIQKPRTAKGWTGPVNQPDPFRAPDIEEGIQYARSLMVKISEIGLPIADEAVFINNAPYFIDLLSWVAIGARSSENQEHRIFASALDCSVGMKNPTSGAIDIGINSIIAAQQNHTAIFHGQQIETRGNPYAHLVLRGGTERTNYHTEDLYTAKKYFEKQHIANPAIVIDASHDNCKIDRKKDPLQQINVIHEVLNSLRLYPDLRRFVKGFMIESFLKTGSQKPENFMADTIDKSGLSITDPCLGFEQTQKLVMEIADFTL